ncbi:uncharacterized protein LOC144124156 [Amblyomma americanum]
MNHGRNEAGLDASSPFRRPHTASSMEASPRRQPGASLSWPWPVRTCAAATGGAPQRSPCLRPPPSAARNARDYEDQLHLAASSTTLPERSLGNGKESLTSVLVMLALCVFVGLIVSAVLATTRRLNAGTETEAARLDAAPAYVPPPGIVRWLGSRGGDEATSTTDGTGVRTNSTKSVGGQRENASVHLDRQAWPEGDQEQREWTEDFTSDLAEESGTASTAADNSTESVLTRTPVRAAASAEQQPTRKPWHRTKERRKSAATPCRLNVECSSKRPTSTTEQPFINGNFT